MSFYALDEADESEAGEPAAVGVAAAVPIATNDEDHIFPISQQPQSRRHPMSDNTTNNTTNSRIATQERSPKDYLLSRGATWVGYDTSEPATSVCLRFGQLDKAEAHGLIKLGIPKDTGIQYYHEFFTASLADFPDKDACGDRICHNVQFDTERGSFMLLMNPFTPPPRALTPLSPRPQKTPRRMPAASAGCRRTTSPARLAEFETTYAAVVKGVKPIKKHSIEEDVGLFKHPGAALEVAVADESEEEQVDFPPPLPSPPPRYSALPPLIEEETPTSAKAEPFDPSHSGQRKSRFKRRSSSASGPLFGTEPFSTTFTQSATMSGHYFPKFSTFTGLRESAVKDIKLRFIGTTSSIEFISATAGEGNEGVCADEEQPQLQFYCFQPEKRKASGWLESSCEYTIV